MQIAVIFINIGSYHAARLEAAHAACRPRGWTLSAIQVTNDTLEHSWGDPTKAISMPVKTLLEKNNTSSANAGGPFSEFAAERLQDYLNTIKPDAILVPGWSFSVAIAALKWCRRHKKIAVLASESNAFDAPRKWWRERFKSWRVKQFSSALVGGKSHARYLVELGFDPKKIAYGYDVVNNELFHPDRIRNLPSPCERPYFLAVSRFIPKKNLMLLLDCYAAYRKAIRVNPLDLVLCGSGQMKAEIERYVEENDLSDCIHLPGFLEPDALVPYFAHARCFVHASIEEQWGLVVNEALAAGLPVLVSNRCGCFEDLVKEGVNGFGFEPTDRERLTSLMMQMSEKNDQLESMGRASLQLIRNFPARLFGEGLVKAVDLASPK